MESTQDISYLIDRVNRNPHTELTEEEAGALSDYYWSLIAEGDKVIPEKRTPELDKLVYRFTSEAVRLDPYNYSYRMGQCYAEGIDCDAKAGFRLARKYWEDAYDFGCWWAAESIADLYEKHLRELPDTLENQVDKANCERQAASWRRMALRARERAGQPGWADRK